VIELTFESPMPVSAAELYAYHSRDGAFGRLLPPWDRVSLVEPHPGIRDGSQVRLCVRKGPLTLRACFEHLNVIPGAEFTDKQVAGPFQSWTHRHRFLPVSESSSLMRDEIRFSLPGGPLGNAVAGGFMKRDISSLFAFRHARLAADLERLNRFSAAGWQGRSVAVSGSSGTIGSPLCDVLSTCSARVCRMVRAGTPSDTIPHSLLWRPPDGSDPGSVDAAALEGMDAVIHLAGERIVSGRWTDEKKRLIRDSRVEGTRLISRALADLSRRPRVLIVASGISYYGERGEQEVAEDIGVGSGFRAEVARDWESAAEPARVAGIRVVHLRLGAVLSIRGGVLALIDPLFRLGLGGIPGSGDQWVSWISIEDTISAILHCMTDDTISGPVNVTAPIPVRMQDFAHELVKLHGSTLFARIPVFAVRATFSDKADVLLESCRAVPAKLRKHGFRFAHSELADALRSQTRPQN
jgi:uncharacterized protein (TIGR01777 family)